MEKKFQEIVDDVKARSRKLRRDGRRCCANQVLCMATYLENELSQLRLARKESNNV